MQLEFAHAIFERRLTDSFVDVEYRDSSPFGMRGTVVLNEPLHDQSAERIVEAVENLARTIAYTAAGNRTKIVCSHLVIRPTNIQTTVFEFRGIT